MKLQLPGSDGKVHALGDYLGRKVVLFFYPKDHTPGCTQEACAFRDRHAALRARMVTLIGVSRDSIEKHGRFASDYQLPFLLLSDPEAELHKAYGAWGEKTSYGKTTVGAIRTTVVLDERGQVIKKWSPVKGAADHPAEVLEWLSALP